MSFKLINKSIIFLHVPKCGGSSVFRTLKSHKFIEYRLPSTHDSISNYLNKNITADIFFTQVRNPYFRFYSQYHFMVETINKRIKGELPLKGRTIEYYNRVLNYLIKIEFEGYVNLLIDLNKRNAFFEEFDNIGHLAFQRIVGFLNEKVNLKVFKLEDGNIWSFIKKMGYNVEYTFHEKKSSYRTVSYNSELSEIVYNYFKEDFIKYNYQKDSWFTN